ncbi:anti-sigma factor domain-containing protein [Robertkochia flava]|uniref:anti-sigma factor domain-containing protein n=1 Tax=Robertkochia flava TaxID=3447986 RepID=UPI001CCBA071|nr:anti-sigma factor [Robertkochia marina]
MKDTVRLFLESDLLERYLTGDTDFEENLQTEHFIDTYPEVAQEYDKLQIDLEQYARSFSKPLPEAVKNTVREQLSTPEISLDAATTSSGKRSLPWYFAAAIISTFLMGAATVALWNQNQMLTTEKSSVVDQMQTLKNDIVETNSKLELLKSKYAVLSDPDTKQYIFEGNERAKNLRSVAYINPKEGLSAINVVSLPDLPKEKVFKMWAEVNGKMVCLGELQKADLKLMSLPLEAENASSIKITIESKANKDFAAIDSEVAKIDFNRD